MAWESKSIFSFPKKRDIVAIIKIKIKKLDGDYNYLNLILRTFFFKKIVG